MKQSYVLERFIRTINYSNAKILAPMVKFCGQPFRVLAKQCGADIVYSEELVDKKLLNCVRIVNEELQQVEYREINKSGRIVFSTSPIHEDKPLVLQIGTADADLAVKVAEKMFPDYDAIDVNCGCPKHFSVHSGMGAKLLHNKDNLIKILTSLVKAVGSQGKSVTCKIRLLENIEDTVNLVRSIEQTGVNAIAVHARYVPQRSREKAHLSLLPTLKQAIHIPLIANGDCFTYEDIEKVKQQSGCNSVMIARGAIWNPSIFSSCEELRSKWCNPNVRALEMLQVFEKQQNYFPNTKFIICRMYSDDIGGDFVTRLSQTQDYGSMRDLIYRQIEKEISK